MMQRRRLLSLATVLVVFAMTGCATSSGATGESLAVQLQVDNNLRGISGVSLYLLSDTGGRRSLGPIESNNRQAYERNLRAGDYQLVASRVGAEDIVSERFRVDSDGLVVIWTLEQNQLTFAQR
jgi:predicted small secreted protein